MRHLSLADSGVVQLDQPFCLPFGNRRLLHCLPASQAHQAEGEGQYGEVPAWEACGKVISVERRDYWEFVVGLILSVHFSVEPG
jgi:hypothetical protein